MGKPNPKTKKPENLVLYYIYLAIACAGFGLGIIVLLILFCQYNDINILTHLWLLAIPIISSLLVNVLLVELYRWLRNK